LLYSFFQLNEKSNKSIAKAIQMVKKILKIAKALEKL